MHTRRSRRWLALPLAGALVLAACGDDDDASDATERAGRHRGRGPRRPRPAPTRRPSTRRPTPPRPTRPRTSPRTPTPTRRPRRRRATSTCRPTARPPSIIQTDWYPEAEHGWIYQMVGDGYTIDKDAVSVTGPLVRRRRRDRRGHRDPLRRPGHRQPDGDVAAVHRRRHPARLRVHRRGHPERRRVPDHGGHGGHGEEPADDHVGPGDVPRRRDDRRPRRGGRPGPLLRRRGVHGVLHPDGHALGRTRSTAATTARPANFIAAEGKPTPSRASGRPSRTSTSSSSPTGASRSPTSTSTTPAGRTTASRSPSRPRTSSRTGPASRSSCRSSSSRASTTWPTRPRRTSSSSPRSTEFDSFWTYSAEIAEYAVQTMIDDGLLSNGPDGTLGNFDLDRVNGLIEKAIPVYTALGQAPPDGLTAEDIVTNEFIDEPSGCEPERSDAPVVPLALGSSECQGYPRRDACVPRPRRPVLALALGWRSVARSGTLEPP